MITDQPSVTVLTTVYNGVPYLAEAIESVLNQTWTDFEFLIIDDASTDSSLERIVSYKDPRIRVIENEHNIGQTASLNKGLHLARGRLIARLDQDDACLPKRLEEQVAFLDANPAISIVCSWEYTIDSDGRKVREWKRKLDNYGVFLGYILLGLCPIWHPSVMFRKDDIVRLNCFDTSYAPAEDYDLWSRMAIHRLDAAIVPRFHLLQRVHGQRQSVLQVGKQLDSTRRIHEKTVSQFIQYEDVGCLAALLRLAEDPCGKGYEKRHVRDIAEKLDEMLRNVERVQNLSIEELRSLRKRIYLRVGWGIRCAAFLTRMPSIFFYPIFYMMSPLLLPNVRILFASGFTYIQKLRYRLWRRK